MPVPGASGLFDDLVETTPPPAPAQPAGLFDDLVGVQRSEVVHDTDRPGGDAPPLEPSFGSRLGNTRAFGFAANLAPWVMGPVGITAAVGTDVGDRYGRMRKQGHGVAASALGGVAQGAVELGAGPLAKLGLGKPAAALGAGLLDAVGGRAGAAAGGAVEHGIVGAGAGELMGLGTGTVSAVSGDPNAAEEFRSSGEQGLVLGALGAAAGAGSGALRGRLEMAENRAVAGEPAEAPIAAEAPAAPATGMFADLVEPAPAEARAEPAPAPEPSGIFDDLAPRTPLAEGVPLNDIGALRARAGAHARGELDQPPPSAETPTPITGSPVLPETTASHEALPEAAPHVQGAPGEPAAENGGRQGEAGGLVREPAAAGAAQAGDAPGRLLTGAPDAVRGRGPGAAPGPAEARPTDAAPVPVPSPEPRHADVAGPPVQAAVEPSRVGGEASAPASAEAPPAPVAARPPATGGPAAADAPVADQRATSARPDLAIPSHEPAAREAFKAADQRRTAAGEPAVRSRASQTEAAAERVAADPGKEIVRIRKHVESGGALSEQDAQILRIRAEQHVRAGDHAEAVKAAALYRRGKGEGARATGSGYDPLESAPKRAQRHVTDAMLEPDAKTASVMDEAIRRGDRAGYDRALEQAARQNKALTDEVKRLTGLDPHDLAAGAEPKRQPPKPTVQERTRKAILDVDREYRDLLTKFKDSFRSKSAGALGGEQLALLSQVISNRIKAGVLRAADVAIAIAKALPRIKRDPEMQKAFADEWKKQQGEDIDPATLFEQKAPKPPKPAPTLDEQVASAQEKLNAAIERHHQAMGETPAERLAAIEAKKADRAAAKDAVHPEVQALLDQRKALDAEVRKRDRIIYQNAMRVLDAIATVKADAWDKVYEYRRNVVHTSLRLPLKKIASDVSNTLLHLVTDFALRPLINKIPGGEDRAAFGDAAYVMRGILPGLREGWRNALESWATLRNVWQEQLAGARMQKALEAGESVKGHSDEFHQPRALTGLVGKLTSFNIRATGAFQTFAETLLAHMQVGAEAYRRAYDMKTGERLTGEALEDHMHRETSDFTSESWTKADTTAKDVTMVTPHKIGPIAWLNKLANLDVSKGKTSAEQSLLRLAKETTRHTFLFRTLPFNNLVKGIYHATPLNGLTILARGAKSLTGLAKRGREGWTYSRAEFNTDAAKHAIGWGVMLTVSSLMDDENGQPRITGFGPWKPSDSDLPAPPEHSIRVNGEWHDYSGMGPLSGAIGLAVDTLRGLKGMKHGKSGEDASADVLKSLGAHVVNESYLRGLRDLSEAVQSSGKGAKLVGTFASSFYPTMFKDLGKATTSTIPDRQTKEPGFWARTAQVAEQQLSLPGVAMTPQVDIFGKDIAKDDGHGLLTSFVDRAINPFTGPPDVRDGDADPYRKMLVKWNEEHPNDQLLPKTPSPYVMLGRKRIALTPEQYHALCADAGERLMGFLKDSGIDAAKPTQEDIDAFKIQVAEAQREARDELKFQLVNSSGAATASPGTPGAGASE